MAAAEIARQLVDAGKCGEVTSNNGSVWTTDRGQCFVKMGTGGADDVSLLKRRAEGLAAWRAASLRVPKP